MLTAAPGPRPDFGLVPCALAPTHSFIQLAAATTSTTTSTTTATIIHDIIGPTEWARGMEAFIR